MQICRSKQAIRNCVGGWRKDGHKIALVATMGALHQGHLHLLTRAREWLDSQGGGRIVVSIFVNPTQFDRKTDLDSYPRDEENDLRMLRAAGCDAAFLPDAAEIYGPRAQTFVEVKQLSRVLIGRLRPGHFPGMTTIVTKLFNIVGPDATTFGEKDYQQLTIVRRMVADLDMPIHVIGVPTVREADGLAMSSRNRRLSPEDRAAAAVLNRALDTATALVAEGTGIAAVRKAIRDVLSSESRAETRSVDIRAADDLSLVRQIDRPVVILLAVRFGEVLLIDQRVAHP